MKVAIIGTGYVGLTTGVALAYLGHDVVGVDIDEEKVNLLNRGFSPIFEPHLSEILKLAKNNITFTDKYDGVIETVDAVFIAVGTPPLSDGRPNLDYFRNAVLEISKRINLESPPIIINKSTVPVGTGFWVKNLISSAIKNNVHENIDVSIDVVSNPEFLREGSALFDTFYPDRIVIGVETNKAAKAMYELYKPIIMQNFEPPEQLPRPKGIHSVPYLQMDVVSAELTKYAANAFLALKISFINEMAEMAEYVGADITQVSKAMGIDKRIGGLFLKAGVGWGGSCFGKDTSALIETARQYKKSMPIVEAARSVNYKQRERIIEKLQQELKLIRGRTIGVLGLTFKPHTDDLRDSPAITVVKMLQRLGAFVKVHDPVALKKAREQLGSSVCYCDDLKSLASDSSALLLITEWPDYQNASWQDIYKLMANPLIIDGRNFLNCQELSEMGFKYIGMGRKVPCSNTNTTTEEGY